MIRIEYMRDEHLPSIAALHRRIFRSHMTAEDLRWKYSSEHTGLEHGCFVAMDGDRAVAFSGGLPQIFELDGTPIVVGQSCDQMADDGVRGRGAFGELLERTEQRMTGSGAALMYGAGNRSGMAAVLRMGWQDPGWTLSRFSFETPTLPLARWLSRVPFFRTRLAGWVRHGFVAAAPASDFVDNSLAGQGWLVHKYSPKLFRSKARGGSFSIRVGHARAWLKAAPDVMIGDLFAPDVPTLSRILDVTKRRASFLGIGTVHCFAFPGVPLDSMLQQILPRSDGHFFAVRSKDAGLVDRFRFGLADLDTF